jgi:predicted transposase/invertase (TIGR01784 family)
MMFLDKKVFLPVKSDILFHLFFADERNEEFLISFLKSVLELPDDEYKVIEISDPHLRQEYEGDKLAIIDVKLKTKSKKIIHIEIQLKVTPELKNRILLYASKLITEQIGSGQDYNVIKKVICIVITDEPLIEADLRYHHRFVLYDRVANVEFTDLIELHTLELLKIPDADDGTELYDWTKFIAAETDEELDKAAENNQEVKKAAVKYRELTADERTREMYERREKARRDAAMHERWAIKQSKFEFARKLIRRNRPIEEIIEDTGLSFEEVEELRNA